MNVVLNDLQKTLLHKLTQNKSSFLKKPKSFYIYGKTGCGKTTIMEHFLLHLQTNAQNTARNTKIALAMHFHDYLLDITKLLVKNSPKDIANEISKRVSVLCFDEFLVESIADAKILHDILTELFKNGVYIVTTSNFTPEDLYKDGFNRQIMFPKFSDMIHTKMEVVEIIGQDYRTQKTEITPIYFKTIKLFEEVFQKKIFTKRQKLEVDANHFVEISGTFQDGVVINYEDIFTTHTSVKDFRFLARKFPHIHIHKMRTFCQQNEDEAIRFRNLIDIAYTRSTVITMDGVDSVKVFAEEMLCNIKYMRCQSRLFEMESSDYILSETKNFKRKMTSSSFELFQILFKKMC